VSAKCQGQHIYVRSNTWVIKILLNHEFIILLIHLYGISYQGKKGKNPTSLIQQCFYSKKGVLLIKKEKIW
jgi:hypothetical protein